MKTPIIAFFTLLSLSLSSFSFASNITTEETNYLFGAEERIEMQAISDNEMETTEGQLFGITIESTLAYMDKATQSLNPLTLSIYNKVREPIANFLVNNVLPYFFKSFFSF